MCNAVTSDVRWPSDQDEPPERDRCRGHHSSNPISPHPLTKRAPATDAPRAASDADGLGRFYLANSMLIGARSKPVDERSGWGLMAMIAETKRSGRMFRRML